MSNLKILKHSKDIDIDSIFERKIELGAVIQFNLLQKILEEFIKRQKSMDDKITDLDTKISFLSTGGNEFDLLLQTSEEDYNLKINEGTDKNKDIERNILDKVNDENNNQNIDKNKDIDIDKGNNDFIYDEKEVTTSDNKHTNLYKKLVSRIDRLEYMHREMIKLMKKSNNEMKLSFIDLKTKSQRDHKNNENKINEISQKLSDINIFDMFKGDNTHNENDKELLNSLEQKLSERMDNLEEKNKLNDDSIYRLKKDFVNLKNLTENISRLTSNNQENYLSLSKDIDSKIKALNTKIDEEVNKVKDICNNNYNENKNETLKKYNELNNKISILMGDFNSFDTKINSMNQLRLGNEKIEELNNALKKYINKSISDTEKYLKSIINDLNIDEIKKNISKIQEELNQNKLLKNDIDLINNKITDTIEKKLAELDQKVDAQSTDINMCNDTCNKTVKMVEYLSGQVLQTYQPDLDKDGKNGILNYNNLIKQNMDMTSYMTKELFIEERNKIIKKIEKTLEIESGNYSFIKKLEEKIKSSASENDLKDMEQCLINMLEELKLNLSKKYLDKNDAQKSFKYIELQLKQIIEASETNNKEADNWMLAKKPINSYVCASCESYLGELKNKNIFLPWNKIPIREEKKYRMGQGFSKMLQLVNMDLLKNADRINNDLTIKDNIEKDDDKKVQENKKLPKIRSQMSLSNLYNNYSMIQQTNDSVEHIDYGLNNSADNVEPVTSENKKDKNKNHMNSSCYNKMSERDINNIKNVGMKTNYKKMNYGFNKTANTQEPHIMKIVKKVKK